MADRKKPTQEDIDLFRSSVGAARPVKSERVAPVPKRPAPRPRRSQQEARADSQKFLDAPVAGDLAAEDPLLFVRPGVQQRQLQRLRRGKLPPGEELDLHGMTTAVAREAVSRFIGDCREQGIRCVRIIHGKGYGSGTPTLKNHVNTWLRQHHDVLAFTSTPGRHGGTGAVYVLLRSR